MPDASLPDATPDATQSEAGVDGGDAAVAPAEPDAVLGCNARPASSAPTFQILTTSLVTTLNYYTAAVSADGSVVIGMTQGRETTGNESGYYWSAAEGAHPFSSRLIPTGLTCDGSVIVGVDGLSNEPTKAYRWTRANGRVPLPIPGTDAWVRDIDANGDVIVGNTGNAFPLPPSSPDPRPIVWTVSAGVAQLAPLGTDKGVAWTVSAAGDVVTGDLRPSVSTGSMVWCRWNQGACAPYTLPGQTYDVRVSADGRTLTGRFSKQDDPPLFKRAFYWNSVEGLVEFACPDASSGCGAVAASSSGRYIVADGGAGSERVAFLWDRRHGARAVRKLLTDRGVSVPVDAFGVSDISDDGLVLVGSIGTYPAQLQAFRITLPASIYD